MSDEFSEKKPAPSLVVAADGHTYHKSATANATVAPTNTHTLENAVKDKNILGPEKLEFVTLVHMEYGVQGKVPTYEFLESEYEFSLSELQTLFEDELVLKALEERGIPIRRLLAPVEDSKRRAKLTPLQLVVANVWLDLTDNRSPKKKLSDHGVTSATWQMWLRDPNFSGYLKDRAEALIGDYQHEAMLSLADKVAAGDMKAIQYYHELTGRHTPAASNGTGNASTHDFQRIIVDIIEIIVDEVDDPQTALRISDRLKGLVMGNQVAGVLPVAIEKPEMAEARTVTPQVQAMMDKGLGYDN